MTGWFLLTFGVKENSFHNMFTAQLCLFSTKAKIGGVDDLTCRACLLQLLHLTLSALYPHARFSLSGTVQHEGYVTDVISISH